jgi:hypothetical protein
VKTTFVAEDVSDLKRLQRVSATSRISYKDAILQLKKKAAEIGATTVLVMDDPDGAQSAAIEVIGIAYRDESIPAVTAPRDTQRSSTPAQTSSNTRRRRILQQMEGYNNDTQLDLGDRQPEVQPRRETARETVRETGRETARETARSGAGLDAVYLLNGREIRGTIEEFEPDDFVSIRTENGRIYEYSMDDVQRVQRTSSAKAGSSRSTARTSSKKDDYVDDDYYDSRPSNRQTRPSRYDDEMYYGSTSGYKGTFDAGYTLPVGIGEKGRFEVHTSHGYQINEYLYIGVGAGLHAYSARDILLKSNMGKALYPQYAPDYNRAGNSGKIDDISKNTQLDDSVVHRHSVDSFSLVIPLFLDIRGYYPMGQITPFAMLRAGYSFNLTDGFGGMGLFINPAIGVKYNMSPKLGITLTLGYSIQDYGGLPKNGGYGFYYFKNGTEKDKSGYLVPYEAKKAGGLTLQLGVEF